MLDVFLHIRTTLKTTLRLYIFSEWYQYKNNKDSLKTWVPGS